MIKRKIRINMIILYLFFQFLQLQAHKEWVHQFVVKEAYKLLSNEVGPIVPLNTYCGFNYAGVDLNGYDRNPEYWVPIYSIINGAFMEDVDDMIWEYKWNNKGDASASHFWNADEGDDEKTTDLPLNWLFGDAHNSYTKARAFSFNGQGKLINISIPVELCFFNKRTGRIFTNKITFDYPENNNILDFIKTGDIKIKDWTWSGSGKIKSALKCSNPKINNINEYPFFTNNSNNYVVGLGMIGRICHLIADMTVPAHIHEDSHICQLMWDLPIEVDGDLYELTLGHLHYLNGTPYSWDRNSCNLPPYSPPEIDGCPTTFGAKLNYTDFARSKGGLIWEVFQMENQLDVLRYLMYTANQLADIYPSYSIDDLKIEKEGDKDLTNTNNGSNPFLIHHYNIINPSQTSVNPNEQALELLTYAIRATATYLYWISWKLDWLDHTPTCKNGIVYLQNDRFFGYHTNKNNNNLEFKSSEIPNDENSGIIMAGSDVHPNSLVHNGDVIVDPSINLTLKAEKSVILKPGFFALSGSNFIAKIENITCTENYQPLRITSEFENSKKEEKPFLKMKIFPNPTYSNVKISFVLNDETVITLGLFDIYGNEIFPIYDSDIKKKGEYELNLDLSQLPTGQYLLKSHYDNNIETYKIQILK